MMLVLFNHVNNKNQNFNFPEILFFSGILLEDPTLFIKESTAQLLHHAF